MNLEKWTAYYHDISHTQLTADDQEVTVLLESIRPTDIESFAEEQVHVSQAKSFHVGWWVYHFHLNVYELSGDIMSLHVNQLKNSYFLASHAPCNSGFAQAPVCFMNIASVNHRSSHPHVFSIIYFLNISVGLPSCWNKHTIFIKCGSVYNCRTILRKCLSLKFCKDHWKCRYNTCIHVWKFEKQQWIFANANQDFRITLNFPI